MEARAENSEAAGQLIGVGGKLRGEGSEVGGEGGKLGGEDASRRTALRPSERQVGVRVSVGSG